MRARLLVTSSTVVHRPRLFLPVRVSPYVLERIPRLHAFVRLAAHGCSHLYAVFTSFFHGPFAHSRLSHIVSKLGPIATHVAMCEWSVRMPNTSRANGALCAFSSYHIMPRVSRIQRRPWVMCTDFEDGLQIVKSPDPETPIKRFLE